MAATADGAVDRIAKRAGKKKGKRLPPLERNAKHAAAIEKAIRALAQRALGKIKARLLAKAHGKVAKTDASDAAERLQEFLDNLSADDLEWTESDMDELRDLIEEAATERADAVVKQIISPADESEIETLLEQANEAAVQWAHDRIGNLITDVTDTTRNAVNQMTADALAEGLSVEQFAQQLDDAWEFGEDRSKLIATTELAEAETQGTLAGYQASGVVEMKGWSADDDACDECAPLDGVEVPLDEDFPDDGGDGPPLHPGCRCATYPVVGSADEGESSE